MTICNDGMKDFLLVGNASTKRKSFLL